MPIDRNLKARAFAYLRAYNHFHKTKGQHLGPLTRTCREVLRALLWLTDRRGCVSYLALAREAGCSLDSVWRALKRLRASGLLAWSNRYAWNPRHNKVTRTLNEYTWLEPVMPGDVDVAAAQHLPKTENRFVALTSQDSSGASQVKGAAAPACDGLEAAISRLLALRKVT